MKIHRFTGILPALIIAFAGSLFAQDMEHIDTKAAAKQETTKTETPKQEMTKPSKPTIRAKSTIQKVKDIVVIETNMGTIEVSLFRAEAPKTVENFEGLAKKGYYNGIVFHRVISNFMIQGGDPTGTGTGGESLYGKDFEDEISPKLTFDRAGLLAMANRGPNTNGSQFFITLAPTPWLNTHHTIFGEVVVGKEVVDAIGKVQTTKPGDKPVKAVVMNKMYLKGSKDKTAKGPDDKK
jgi:cyclophilin family peptidyl-prolyl cis-trans isomerase